MRETPVPDKADRKRPVEVRFLANGAGLEMIIKRMSESGTDKLGACPCYPRLSSQNGTGGGTCEDPKMAKNEDTDVWKFPCSAPRERSRSL